MANSSLYVPDVICFAFVYLTNMDRPSITLTGSLILHKICGKTGPPQRIDSLTPLWEYWCKVFFQKTQQYIAQSRNQIKNRQPCSCQLALLSIGLRAFAKDTTAGYDQCGNLTSNLVITIRHSNRQS